MEIIVGECLNIVSSLHKSTTRKYFERMADDKVTCMERARLYAADYWDGDRRYGYGGYKYIPGRWGPVASRLIDEYGLTGKSRILDVGCGKAFLLSDIKSLIPEIQVVGFDISTYGLAGARGGVREHLFYHRAEEQYPFETGSFDLVISLACLHNLRLPDVARALGEISRVGNKSYVMVESYRDSQELFNLQCWALTAETFLTPDEWEWFFSREGYVGDYEFIFFE